MYIPKTLPTFLLFTTLSTLTLATPTPQDVGDPNPGTPPNGTNIQTGVNGTLSPLQNQNGTNRTAPDNAFTNSTGDNNTLPVPVTTPENDEKQRKFAAFLQAAINCTQGAGVEQVPGNDTDEVEPPPGFWFSIPKDGKLSLDDIPPECLVIGVVENDEDARDEDGKKVGFALNTPYSEYEDAVFGWKGFEDEIRKAQLRDPQGFVRAPKTDGLSDDRRKYADSARSMVEQKLRELIGKDPKMINDADDDGEFKIEDGEVEVDGDDVDFGDD